VGQVRIVVDPEYRSKGIGATMLHELASIADENGLERVMLEAVAEREDQAIKAAEFVGFVRVGLLPGHARDLDGRPRDIVILEMPLGKWFDWWDF
jgi:L-amino acid N-acyltransferase YncA